MIKEDKNGYLRGELKHSDLIHRQIAYKEIYLKDRKKYPLPFSHYVIHHKDRKKKNNHPSNLEILTEDEHNKIHEDDYSEKGTIFLVKWAFMLLSLLPFLALYFELKENNYICGTHEFICASRSFMSSPEAIPGLITIGIVWLITIWMWRPGWFRSR